MDTLTEGASKHVNFIFLFKKKIPLTQVRRLTQIGVGALLLGLGEGVVAFNVVIHGHQCWGDLMSPLSHVDKVLHSGLTAPYQNCVCICFCVSVYQKKKIV